VYDTVEDDKEPVWKSYLYQLQQKAPQPICVVCNNEVVNRVIAGVTMFHGSISREEADELVSRQDGCYLVRESQRSPWAYTLTMRFDGTKNFRLYYDGMHYVGDKRFQTIHELVADGLITMYMDTYAKDYIDTMMIDAVRPDEGSKEAVQENGQVKAVETDGAKTQTGEVRVCDRRFSASKRPSVKPSAYTKAHNFKTNTFKGPHWCDHCRNFLWGLTMQGVKCQDCGFNAHKQCTKAIPNNCKPDKKYIKRAFGVDLTTLVKLHNTKRPFVVDICINEVEKRGLDSEGLYRVSGFADDIEALKNSFDKGNTHTTVNYSDGESVNLSTYDDINTITGVCKLYFRQLPLPLITFETYSKFIAAAKTQDKHLRIEELSKALGELPQAHYETMKFLMGHLHRVSQRRSKNMMTEENLSIVFGPTLMRAPEGDSLDSLVDMKFQRLAVELLISHQHVLFDTL
ncbi:predicted protein, partial [Nematostella vectensis]